MALEATHIRFALDLKDEFQVQDIEKYISGTIYPDSRYVTKIDRNLTHRKDILRPEFATDDFKKGWQVHIICDAIQNKKRMELLLETLVDHNDVWNKDEWANAYATKIIQDMRDFKCYNLEDNLKYLNYAFNPNGEDIEDIKRYNQIMIDLYKGKKETTVEDIYNMCLALGISKENGNIIKLKTEEYLKNKDLVDKIELIYDEMVRCYEEVL